MLGRALSVKQVLLLGFFLTALLPMLLMTLLAFYQARTVVRDEITHDMQTRASAALSEVDRTMFERLQNVASWSRLDIMMSEARIGDIDKRLSHFLGDLKQSYRGVYHVLYVVGADHRIVASSDPAQIGKPAPEIVPWQHIQIANQPLVLGAITRQQLPIGTEIMDFDQQRIGTLWAVFNWNEIEKILINTQSQGSAAALLDEQGQALAQTSEWSKIKDAHDVSVQSNGSGLSTQPLFNWQVEISQYRSVVMAPVHRMAYIFILILLITAILATMLAAPLSRFITRPLATLTAYARRFMRASIQTNPPQVAGPHEVQEMTSAFAKMIDDLNVSKENLTRAAKLAVAGEMAAAMSHEIRTPLGILRSSAQVLGREKNLSAEAREVASFITTETERLNKLVSTLVDSARPRQPEFAMHNVVALLENAVAMMRMQASKKEISLDFTAPSQNAVMVECDAEQITQVVLNLLLNAIQVLDHGCKVLVTLLENPDAVTISVADNGKGVDESLQEQIFDPFFTQRKGGIGLGLAVSRQIVLAHFGSLTVQKNMAADHGADFRVKLPTQQIH